jgi:hypothetical protein
MAWVSRRIWVRVAYFGVADNNIADIMVDDCDDIVVEDDINCCCWDDDDDVVACVDDSMIQLWLFYGASGVSELG